MPWISPALISSKTSFQQVSPPLGHSGQPYTGCYFSHLKKKIPSWTSQPLPPPAISVFSLLLRELVVLFVSISSPPILSWTHHFRAYVPTCPLIQRFLSLSVKWPPCSQIILFYSSICSWLVLPVLLPLHLWRLWPRDSLLFSHSLDPVSWLQISSKCLRTPNLHL